MVKYNKELAEQVDKLVKTPQGRAYLRMIQAAEGGDYNRTFGNGLITDFSKHPNKAIRFSDRAGGGVSTAAGAYQITNPTWNSMASMLGINDFGKDSQDKVALGLALEKKGMYDAIMKGDIDKMVSLSNNIFTSLPGSVEGGKRHALRTKEFLKAAYDDKLKDYKGPTWTANGKSFGSVRSGGSSGVSVDLLTPALENLMRGTNGSANFLENTIRDIQGKTYADPGAVPFQVASTAGSSHSVYGTMDTDPQVLVNRLFNQDPNTSYGLSFIGGSLRPTISTVNPQGDQINMVELPNGRFINAATGEQLNEDGTVYEGTPVEYLTPDYEAPQNSPEAMAALRAGNERQAAPMMLGKEEAIVPITQPEYNINPPTAEAALPTSNTPLTSTAGSVASPIAYADPNVQVVNALGGDAVTRALNASRPVDDNLKELLRLA